MAYPENLTEVVVDSTVSLTCVAYGEPIIPSITWSRNGSNLGNDSRILISEDVLTEGGVSFIKATLQICNVETSDMDLYSCVASIEDLNDTFTFVLSVVTSDGMYYIYSAYVYIYYNSGEYSSKQW